ncbi:MAG TPA: biopolymer transporter ExbD [Cryomorphaceae bacterium]|nr:biopolymer transporter ExbD [Cryomorphaceae bacterium]
MDLRPRSKVDASFSMSSMTDLVFLLLIFFIILSTLVSPYALPVDLPVSANRTKEKPQVALRIDKDLIYSVDNRIIDREGLENVLAGELQGVEDAGIVLHVDQQVPTGRTVEVLDIAKRNGWRIVLATKPE